MAAAAMVFAGCSKDLYPEVSESTTTDPPSYAASNKIWTIGDQVWSDAIRIPDCNKTSFEHSETDPQCRSYTEGSNTWYYYNWPYVNVYASRLCPSPWRVPTRDDFEYLVGHTSNKQLVDRWGYGGHALSTSVYSAGSEAFYWSTTELSTDLAYLLYFDSSGSVLAQGTASKRLGFQVRCVK